VHGEALDSNDPGDCLSPQAWQMPSMNIVRVSNLTDSSNKSDDFLLITEESFEADASYQVSLAPQARAYYGQPTSTNAFTFQGSRLLPSIESKLRSGADLMMPISASETGDLELADVVESVKTRLQRIVQNSQGFLAYEPKLGRGIEPKRNYSKSNLLAECRAMKDALLLDPLVRHAQVSTRTVDSIIFFDINVTTRRGSSITFSVQRT